MNFINSSGQFNTTFSESRARSSRTRPHATNTMIAEAIATLPGSPNGTCLRNGYNYSYVPDIRKCSLTRCLRRQFTLHQSHVFLINVLVINFVNISSIALNNLSHSIHRRRHHSDRAGLTLSFSKSYDEYRKTLIAAILLDDIK